MCAVEAEHNLRPPNPGSDPQNRIGNWKRVKIGYFGPFPVTYTVFGVWEPIWSPGSGSRDSGSQKKKELFWHFWPFKRAKMPRTWPGSQVLGQKGLFLRSFWAPGALGHLIWGQKVSFWPFGALGSGSQKLRRSNLAGGPRGPAWSLGQWISLREIVTDHDRGFCLRQNGSAFQGLRPRVSSFGQIYDQNRSF